MAGHSKWANIKHRKERADAKKGKIFSRIVKEIISAVKTGGEDPKSNPRLRLALQKAKENNVPNDVVERNIKKALNTDQAEYAEVTYEIYGHGGVGIIVEAMTDNKNRTASDMRIATNKRGGSIASPGSVAFNFDRKGIIQIDKHLAREEDLFIAASEAGAEDFDINEEIYLVITDPAALYAVKEELEKHKFPTKEANLEMIPKTTVDCDEETAKANFDLIEWIENLDDVDAVYHNME
ncbi:MAG: YebC/PmpR family DNA-binding transcriptional regulator [Chlamydiales bacterium]